MCSHVSWLINRHMFFICFSLTKKHECHISLKIYGVIKSSGLIDAIFLRFWELQYDAEIVRTIIIFNSWNIKCISLVFFMIYSCNVLMKIWIRRSRLLNGIATQNTAFWYCRKRQLTDNRFHVFQSSLIFTWTFRRPIRIGFSQYENN